jgi:hypothetical protein
MILAGIMSVWNCPNNNISTIEREKIFSAIAYRNAKALSHFTVIPDKTIRWLHYRVTEKVV